MKDDDLRGHVAAELSWDPQVGSETVCIPDKDRRDDEDLRGDVLEALMLDVSVPMTVRCAGPGRHPRRVPARCRPRTGRAIAPNLLCRSGTSVRPGPDC